MKAYRIPLLAPLSPSVYARRAARSLPWPLEEPDCLLFARARHALYSGIHAAGLRPGETILVPAYHHGSEVEALVRGGLSCRFYDVRDDLTPDPGHLEEIRDGATRALHLTHFLGLPQDAAFWREWCDDRNLLLIEDAAQGWLGTAGGRPMGGWGDIAIFCPYKTLGIPDGGMLVGPSARKPSGRRPLGARALLRRHRGWFLQRVPRSWRLGRHEYDPNDYDVELDFSLGDPTTPVSFATRALIGRALDLDVAGARRNNYRRLAVELGDLVPPPLRAVDSGACPFVFPVASRNKAALLDVLHRDGIEALSLWSVPHPSLPPDDHPVSMRLRHEVVGLPVHQGLRDQDVDDLVAAVTRHEAALS